MQLEPHLAQVARQLVAAAALGDDRTREIADALAAAAAPAVRLALLDALAEAADEITAALLDLPGSPAVTVRLDGDEVAVEVRAGRAAARAGRRARRDDGEASARISLRLCEALKADDRRRGRARRRLGEHLARPGRHRGARTEPVRRARRVRQELRRGHGAVPAAVAAGGGRQRHGGAHHITGWING